MATADAAGGRTLAQRIKRYREGRGLTRAQAAERWGISTRTLEGFEAAGPAVAIRGLLSDLLDDAIAAQPPKD